MEIRSAFSAYLSHGYRPILLADKSKKPILKKWNTGYNPDYYKYLLKNSNNFNIGLLLGDIIDIEGDNDAANNFLNDLFKNIEHPVFKSLKSTHHLFRNYPGSKITRWHAKSIEIRAYKHQSVVPPSTHEMQNFSYEWQTDLPYASQVPIFTKDLQNRIFNFCGLQKQICKPDSVKAACFKCKNKKFVHRKRFFCEIEIFRATGHLWMCRNCRPKSINDHVRNIRKTMVWDY